MDKRVIYAEEIWWFQIKFKLSRNGPITKNIQTISVTEQKIFIFKAYSFVSFI